MLAYQLLISSNSQIQHVQLTINQNAYECKSILLLKVKACYVVFVANCKVTLNCSRQSLLLAQSGVSVWTRVLPYYALMMKLIF